MDIHRHTGEMLNIDVMITSLGMKKLKTMNEKIKNQLNKRNLQIELNK
jgi:hypothetical protein